MQPDLPRIRDYADLIATMRARREELGWSQEQANDRCGFQDGYYAKLEIPSDVSGRTLTPLTFPCVLTALGFDLVPVRRAPGQVDAAKVGKWKRHKSPKVKRLEHASRSRVHYAKHRQKVRERVRLYMQKTRKK
jgi:hypothetical protein